MPFNHLILCQPLLFLPSIFPSIRVFSIESALCIRWCFSFNISPSNEYSGLISFRVDRFDRCYPRDSQESSLAPQFKSVNFSVLRLLYGPTLTCMHDYWKSHSFDYTDLCWQSNVSALRLYWMRLKIKRHKQCREHRCWHIWVAQYVIVDWLHTCLLTDRQYFRGVGGDPICRTDTS